jgi:hypothetical protein
MADHDATPVLETCEIVWWKGYTKGRFQAYAESPARPRWLAGESPAFRWRSSSPPNATDDAVDAHAQLVRRLQEDGWEVAGESDDVWFGVVMSRESYEIAQTAQEEFEPQLLPHSDRERESALLLQLHTELVDARSATERERNRRLAAEAAPLRLVPPQPRDDRAASRSRLWLVAYAVVVAFAAAIFLIGFHSVYAAVVAALTTSAIALAVDSWLVVFRLAAPPRNESSAGISR